MAAKMGILGESTVSNTGTVTVDTVPSAKAARVKVSFVVDNSSGADISFAARVGMPGSEVTFSHRTVSGVDVYTGMVESTNQQASAIGFIEADSGVPTTETGDKASVVPLPVDFFLSTGDVVQRVIGVTNATDAIFQVMGVEDDA